MFACQQAPTVNDRILPNGTLSVRQTGNGERVSGSSSIPVANLEPLPKSMIDDRFVRLVVALTIFMLLLAASVFAMLLLR